MKESTELPEWLTDRMRCAEHAPFRSRFPDCTDCAAVVEGTRHLLDLLAAHERVWTRAHLQRLSRLLAGAGKP